MEEIGERMPPGDARSLSLLLDFLDAYGPAAPGVRKRVAELRDRIRREPTRPDLESLALVVEGTAFALRRGTVRRLPALGRRLRACAGRLPVSKA